LNIYPRMQESAFLIRVRDVALPFDRGEFLTPAFSYCPDKGLIRVACKIVERRFFPIFLSHEYQGYIRRKDNDAGGKFKFFERPGKVRPVA
jgi:hypothetical protein